MLSKFCNILNILVKYTLSNIFVIINIDFKNYETIPVIEINYSNVKNIGTRE